LFKFLYFKNLIWFCNFKKIEIIHTWCTPAGGMGYLLSLITGKKLILDSFEPHALPMIEGGTWKKKNMAFKLLFCLERKQLKKATEVVCANSGMISHSQSIYKVSKLRYFVKPACVDLNLFSYKNIKLKILEDELLLKNKVVCVYAGKFGGLYLTNETFQFLKVAYDFWGDQFRVLLLSSYSFEEIKYYFNKEGIPINVLILKFVNHNKVADYMGLADFAICPMKPLPSRRYGTPIKNGEYWALGLPIVITNNISDDSDIIKQNNIGSVLEELNSAAYLSSILEIEKLLKTNTRDELYSKIRPFAEKYRNYSIAENVYRIIYNNVL
jgi:hypothetical protein